MDYRNNGEGREPNEAAVYAVTKGLCANKLIRIILNRERNAKSTNARERDISLPRGGLPVAVSRP